MKNEWKTKQLEKLTTFKVALENMEWNYPNTKIKIKDKINTDMRDIEIVFETMHTKDFHDFMDLIKLHKVKLMGHEGKIIIW